MLVLISNQVSRKTRNIVNVIVGHRNIMGHKAGPNTN